MASDTGQRTGAIDATFRNGTMTAVGIMLGFSLGFITRWATSPGVWNPADVLAIFPLLAGVLLQTMALARLLRPTCLETSRYERTMTVFLWGLILTAAGVATGILLDVLGIHDLPALTLSVE